MKKRNNSSSDAFVLGISMGTCFGIMLVALSNEIMYFPLCLVAGLAIGLSVSGEKIEFKLTNEKKTKIKLDLNKEYIIKTTPKKILLNSIVSTLVIGIILFLCLTCYREGFANMLASFGNFGTEYTLECILLILPLIFIFVVIIKTLKLIEQVMKK